jgi:hypothetical protein
MPRSLPHFLILDSREKNIQVLAQILEVGTTKKWKKAFYGSDSSAHKSFLDTCQKALLQVTTR